MPSSTRDCRLLCSLVQHEIRRGSTIAFSSSVRFETRKGTLVPRNTGVVSTEVCFPTISKAPQNGVLELVSPFRPKRGHWKGPRPLKGDTTCEDSTMPNPFVNSLVNSPYKTYGPQYKTYGALLPSSTLLYYYLITILISTMVSLHSSTAPRPA